MRRFTIAAILLVLLSFSAPSRCISNYLISTIVGQLTPIGSTVASCGACDLNEGRVNCIPGSNPLNNLARATHPPAAVPALTHASYISTGPLVPVYLPNNVHVWPKQNRIYFNQETCLMTNSISITS